MNRKLGRRGRLDFQILGLFVERLFFMALGTEGFLEAIGTDVAVAHETAFQTRTAKPLVASLARTVAA